VADPPAVPDHALEKSVHSFFASKAADLVLELHGSSSVVKANRRDSRPKWVSR